MDLPTDTNQEEYPTKDSSLPPPYDIYSENSLTRNINPYKLQQEAAVRLSAHRAPKQPEVKSLEWVLSCLSLFCCLACGIPSIIFTFSACKDAEEGRTIETNRKLKYSRGFAMVAIISGILLYAVSLSVVAIITAIVIIRNTPP